MVHDIFRNTVDSQHTCIGWIPWKLTCANPAFSKAHGIDNNAEPIIVFQIDKMVVKEEFLVPDAIAIADPLMLNDLNILVNFVWDFDKFYEFNQFRLKNQFWR